MAKGPNLGKLHNLPPDEKKADALNFIRSCKDGKDGIEDLTGKLKSEGGFLRTATKSHLCYLYGYTEAEALALIDEYIAKG